MIAYGYNDNMEYIGTVDCQKDPVRSDKEKRDVWLLPANSTFTAHPDFDQETQKAVWDGEAWHIEALPEPEPEPDPAPTTEDRVAALESENKTLKAQVSAQSEQMDFYEECIAEMASVVYA